MKRKRTLIAIFAAAIIAGICAGAVAYAAGSATWSDVTLENVYAYGETLDIPERTLTVGGATIIAQSSVRYPSGKTTNETTVTLNVAGDWAIRYFAEVGGKQYAKEETFSVEGSAYSLKNKLSSATYGEYTEFDADSTGLLVRLAPKDELTFTKLIDVDSLTKNDTIISGFITPDQRGVFDFQKLTVTLTDSLDDSVYLRVDINGRLFSGVNGYGLSWVMAGGNGQDMVGYESNKPQIHVNDDIGESIDLSFVAQNNTGGYSGAAIPQAPDKKPFTISFDAATKSVYSQNKFISDLDDSKYYTDLWSGFKSGKAKLTVSASKYSSTTANFCILSVLGLSDEELAGNTFADYDAPEITIDTDYEIMPTAEKGTAYPIPSATAYDDYSGETEVETSVYYAYSTASPVSIGITDGKFTPARGGEYAIVYTSTDNFGNRAKKVLYVRAAESVADITLTLPDEATTAQLGKRTEIVLPSATGGSGKINIETTVTKGNERVEVINGGFTPETSGEYTVSFTATDYVGKTTTASYTVTATPGDKPIISGEPNLLPVYVSGSKYALPSLTAKDYSAGSLNEVLCDVKVKDANGERTYKAGDEFTPVVANNGDKIEVTYYSGATSLETKQIPVIIGRENSTVYVSNYFYGNVTIGTRDESGTLYSTGLSVTPSSFASAGWTFANPLLTDQTSVQIETLSGKTNYGGFVFTLTDAANPDLSIGITVKIQARKLVVSHGDSEYELAAAIKSGATVKFAYSSGKFVLTAADSQLSVPVTVYNNGKNFDGFDSAKSFVSLRTTDNEADSMYKISSICETVVSYRNSDYTAPMFGVLGDYGGKWSVGSHYTVCAGEVGDVFAPVSEATLTVYAPDGSVATDTNGTRLENVKPDVEYVLLLDTYGKYKLEYTFKEVDWVGRNGSFSVVVTVADETAPEIKWTSAGTTNAKVGDVIVMPSYEVSDNVTASADISVSVYVIGASGRWIELEDGSNSIKCETAGTYTFVVFATDAEGNAATARYSVTVK